MSVSDDTEKNLAAQEKLLKVYFTKALDPSADPMSVMQSMMFATFHQTQILLIMLGEIDDKLDELDQIAKSLYEIEDKFRFMPQQS